MSAFPYPRISEIVAAIRTKAISPLELVDAHLARIAALQPKLNAFTHIDADDARAAARTAESAILQNKSLGPLHGVPISIKSCIDVAGWPCSAGSFLRKDYVAPSDAPLVSRLRAAGAILLGNTNTPEFLMAYETNNLLSGKTSNPWNADYSSGGSSGGEAAAIASGCSVAGAGSDGGGSIRVPAHFCGICGLKSTPGRIPSSGHYPPGGGAFGWLGVVGPMARTVAEVRTLFEMMAGPDPGDPLSTPVPIRRIDRAELRDLRVGILASDALGAATSETSAAVHLAGKLLTQQNFAVEEFRLSGLDRAIELWWFFFGHAIAHLFAPIVSKEHERLSPIFREYLACATPPQPLTAEDVFSSCVARDRLRADLIRQMSGVKILLSPVSASHAFRHGEGTWQSPTGYRETMRHSQWLNLAGFPGAVVPVAFSKEGLPIAVQIIGLPHDEELVLAVAELLEEARGPWTAPPPP